MGVRLAIQVEDDTEFDSLQDWLTGLSGADVTAVPKQHRAGQQGTAWDVLTVACETGGAATVAVQALKTWLESRVTTIRVKIGESDIEVKSTDSEQAMSQVLDTVKALTSDDR
jgi:hypothetical protein